MKLRTGGSTLEVKLCLHQSQMNLRASLCNITEVHQCIFERCVVVIDSIIKKNAHKICSDPSHSSSAGQMIWYPFAYKHRFKGCEVQTIL